MIVMIIYRQLYNHVIMTIYGYFLIVIVLIIDCSPLLFPNITYVFCDHTSFMDIGEHQIRGNTIARGLHISGINGEGHGTKVAQGCSPTKQMVRPRD